MRNILFGLLSGIAGIIFTFSQNKLILNDKLFIVILLAIFAIIFITVKIRKEEKVRKEFIDEIERITNDG